MMRPGGASAAPNRNLIGIALMLLGIFMFAVNDVMGKWLVGTYSVGQLLLIRSVAALLVLAPIMIKEGAAHLRAAPRPGLQLLRVVLSTSEVAAFYWAVVFLPLADVMTFYLAGPVYVAALAVIFLGERLTGAEVVAIAAGFVGVIIALDPSGATFTGPALIAIAGSLCFAALMITTRHLRGTSDRVLVLGQTVGALLFGVVAAPFGWVAPSLLDTTLLSLLGVVALVAHACVNRSLKLAPAAVVSPYQYTLIVWAALFGYVIFGDVLRLHTVIGACLIIASGIYLAALQRKAARNQTAALGQ
jgi:drug/metabolite transporter (DMT)-like permease